MADQTNLPEQRAIHVFASCRVRFEPMLLDSVDVGAGSTTMMRDLGSATTAIFGVVLGPRLQINQMFI
jgi:hypothetical protein